MLYYERINYMILSKNAEIILKELNEKSNEFKSKKNTKDYVSPFYAVFSFSDIQKLLPQESYISLRGLLNYLLKEKYIYNNIQNKEDYISHRDVDEDNVQIFIGEKGIAYLNQKKYVLLAKVIPLFTASLSLLLSLITFIFK